MSLLVIGSTGTLGRQIVRRALNQGFHVKCLVRSFRKASFLKEWGAELIYGDLTVPETIPIALYGITAIIDASTVRSNDLYIIKEVDLIGKQVLIEAAKKADIKHFIFFSFLNANENSHIPIINLKLIIESKLLDSNLCYTIFNFSGFFQGLISQYALPILDQKSVWVTGESGSIAYINTQDIAKFVIRSLSIVEAKNSVFSIIGKKYWNSSEIISLCEKISGKRAQVSNIPISILKILKSIANLFQWTWNISDRLAFIEILNNDNDLTISMENILYTFQFKSDEIESLESYLQDYFEKIMNKLKKLNNKNQDSAINIDNTSF